MVDESVLSRITVVRGDITKENVDAIVNAAEIAEVRLVCFGEDSVEAH